MKTKLALIILSGIMFAACSSDPKPMNTEEKKAVEEQVEKDKAAMDSLEQAIQDQINGMDTVKAAE